MILLRRRLLGVLVVTALAGAGLVNGPGVHAADSVTVGDWGPSQSNADAAYGSEGNSSTSAGWADMADGLTDRPYVTSMSVTNGETTTQIVTATSPVAETVAAGHLGAVVSPVNLCRAGQPEQAGQCYSTPNRVALSVVYGADAGGTGWNFGAPRAESLTPAVTADTVIDMTIALNTLGKSLRWSWLNGDLIDWRTDRLGFDDATVRVRFKPARAPYVSYDHWPSNNGCSATPIFNCDMAQAEAETLSATLLLSLDDTLDSALTGAAFATRDAIAGFLQPGGTAAEPLIDIQAASTHLRSDGTLQQGALEAFLPAGALLNLYGALPSDAGAFFSTTRTGSAGTNSPPTYSPWTASATRSEGVLVSVENITFSTPKYKVKSKLTRTASSGKAVGKTTTVRATVAACTAKAPCNITVYKVNKAGVSRHVGSRTAVLSNYTVRARSLVLPVKSTLLKKGDRYLLVVREMKYKKPLVSTLGTVG